MNYKIIAQDRLVELLKKERLLHNIIPFLTTVLYLFLAE